MLKSKRCINERILVCIYYGPNGERLMQRGHDIASVFNCPLYVLTVDAKPFDELDANKTANIGKWRKLADELHADEFILKDNESRPAYKVIADIAREKKITQIIIGQTVQSRWEQIAKESIVNSLIREIPFVDIHIISVARHLKDPDCNYEKGIRAYLAKNNDDSYKLVFNHTKDVVYEGIFFKEIGTDFNNGILKLIKEKETLQVRVTEDIVTDFTNVELETDDDNNENVFI